MKCTLRPEQSGLLLLVGGGKGRDDCRPSAHGECCCSEDLYWLDHFVVLILLGRCELQVETNLTFIDCIVSEAIERLVRR